MRKRTARVGREGREDGKDQAVKVIVRRRRLFIVQVGVVDEMDASPRSSAGCRCSRYSV